MRLMKQKKVVRHQIPAPTGSHKVGCTDVMTPGLDNGVFFRLFYPATDVQDPTPPDWLPHDSYLKGYAMFFKVWPSLYCKYFPKFVGDVEVPAAWNAPPLRLPGISFPVIVLSHGLGGCRTSYTTLCLEMASQGYVVAALEHRDYSACMTFYYEEVKPQVTNTQKNCLVKKWMLFKKVKAGKGEYQIRNQQVHQRARECSLVLDTLLRVNCGSPVANQSERSQIPLSAFRGLFDMNRSAVAGHSFGGASAITALSKDPRFRVGLGLDTWMFPLREEHSLLQKITQPILFVNMEKFQTKANLKVMKKLLSPRLQRLVVTLKGTVHLNQCDVPFLCDKTMRRLFGAYSKLDRFSAMGLTTTLSNVFLSKQLDFYISDEHESYILKHKNVLKEGINVA